MYLVRHGDTDWDVVNRRRLIGAANDLAPLTDEGVRQILEAAHRLREVSIGQVLASPMTRALQSAALVSRALDVPLIVEFDLHEWVPDLTYAWDDNATVVALYEEMQHAGGEWPADGPRPRWEPTSAVRARARRVLARHVNGVQSIAATHSVVMASLTRHSPAHAEIVRYDFSREARVHGLG
jgi:broad specificity phosphatase PhoE